MFQNLDIIESYAPHHIVLLAGDHVYKMDYEHMLQQHVEQGADVTVGCIEVSTAEASAFGVMGVDHQDRIMSFLEKPRQPPSIPGEPGRSLASMGIYVFETRFLMDQLRRDAADPNSSHDFGKDVIPHIVAGGKAVAHRFTRSCVRSSAENTAYWRDVGTVDAYWEANVDLTDFIPGLDLYDQDWPIWTYAEITPPAKFVHDEPGRPRPGHLVAGVGRLHRVRQHGGPLAAVHRRPRALLCGGARRGDPSLCGRGAWRAAEKRGGGPRRPHPAGLGDRRGPGAGRPNASGGRRGGCAW